MAVNPYADLASKKVCRAARVDLFGQAGGNLLCFYSLSPSGRVGHGGLTQTNESPVNPGRFKVPAGYRRVQMLIEIWMKHVETKKEA